MTKEEILEFNKLCAEFLGWEFHKGYMCNPKGGSPLVLNSYELIFHSDWNWIMEVVEAIEKLGYQFDITGNEVGVNSNIMTMENISTGGTMNSYNRSYYPTIISVCEEEYSKKEAVVQAIYLFLKWYNENKE